MNALMIPITPLNRMNRTNRPILIMILRFSFLIFLRIHDLEYRQHLIITEYGIIHEGEGSVSLSILTDMGIPAPNLDILLVFI